MIMRVMRRLLLIPLLALPLLSSAQDYNVRFETAFINNEFDASGAVLSPSGTIACARISPSVFFDVDRDEDGCHRIEAGVDIMREFGSPEIIAPLKPVIYYRFDKKYDKTVFTAAAGIFPRVISNGAYSDLILSEKEKFYNNNIEGLLLDWRRPGARYELALDWNGMYSAEVREEFNVISSADISLAPWLRAGWQGMFHHYANSALLKGVVDDHVFNPFMVVDFGGKTAFDLLSLQLGPVVSYQRDRRSDDYCIPFGVDSVMDIRWSGFGLLNELYWGDSMCPLWNLNDSAGIPHGGNLYMRLPLWRVSADGDGGLYDKLSLYWMPSIVDFVRVEVSCDFFFNGGYTGCRQIATLLFDLSKTKPKSS